MNGTLNGARNFAQKGTAQLREVHEKFKSTQIGGKVVSTGTVAMEKSKAVAKGSIQMAGKGMNATVNMTKAGAHKTIDLAKNGVSAASGLAYAFKSKLWGAIGKSLSNDKKSEESKVDDELVWGT